MNDEMSDTANTGTEQQITALQGLFEEMQRQMQQMQALMALHLPAAPAPPATPPTPAPAPEHTARSPTNSLPRPKPVRPRNYSGVKDHATIETWIASVDSYFALTDAQPPDIYHVLNTVFTDEAAIWFRYHYRDQASTLTWEEV
jgi:hypothetical protein